MWYFFESLIDKVKDLFYTYPKQIIWFILWFLILISILIFFIFSFWNNVEINNAKESKWLFISSQTKNLVKTNIKQTKQNNENQEVVKKDYWIWNKQKQVEVIDTNKIKIKKVEKLKMTVSEIKKLYTKDFIENIKKYKFLDNSEKMQYENNTKKMLWITSLKKYNSIKINYMYYKFFIKKWKYKALENCIKNINWGEKLYFINWNFLNCLKNQNFIIFSNYTYKLFL